MQLDFKLLYSLYAWYIAEVRLNILTVKAEAVKASFYDHFLRRNVDVVYR